MKLLNEVKNIMRIKHYSIHTENSYCDWIKRFILFHKMQIREEVFIRPVLRGLPRREVGRGDHSTFPLILF
jgi:hypothetical protein